MKKWGLRCWATFWKARGSVNWWTWMKTTSGPQCFCPSSAASPRELWKGFWSPDCCNYHSPQGGARPKVVGLVLKDSMCVARLRRGRDEADVETGLNRGLNRCWRWGSRRKEEGPLVSAPKTMATATAWLLGSWVNLVLFGGGNTNVYVLKGMKIRSWEMTGFYELEKENRIRTMKCNKDKLGSCKWWCATMNESALAQLVHNWVWRKPSNRKVGLDVVHNAALVWEPNGHGFKFWLCHLLLWLEP